MNTCRLMVLLSLLSAGSAMAAEAPAPSKPPSSPKFKPIFDLRLRGESLDTLTASTALDARYEFGLARVRVGGDLTLGSGWTLHGLVQGHAASGLPQRGSFGAGPTYLSANGGDRNPTGFGLAELSLAYGRDGGRLALGRQGFGDGFEAPTGSDFLDGVKRRRFAERLYGNLDFANAGRRFDGATAWVRSAGTKVRLSAYALEPLAGAFDLDDAFDRLDRVRFGGATLTAERGAWLDKGEVRLFASVYDDSRAPIAQVFRRSSIRATTAGASLLTGDDSWDVALWVAAQDQNWSGRTGKAFLVDVGRKFARVAGKPALHLAIEQASGGGAEGDFRGFFNLLPTNHKFYGSVDAFAFSNLRDVYLEATFAPAKSLKGRAALHSFSLVRRDDAWYAGSGAFSDGSFGYAARRPRVRGVPVAFSDRDLGTELDLDLIWTARPGFDVALMGGYLRGGPAIEAIFPERSDIRWLALEVSFKR